MENDIKTSKEKELEKEANLAWFFNEHIRDSIFFLLLAERQMKFLTETARKLKLDEARYFKKNTKQISEICMGLERYCHYESIFEKLCDKQRLEWAKSIAKI